ncbi:MAG: hypothetical protein QG653_710 [Patescibacteria group bacterium]|nr:hypothetical protein [Patescibacteria group bacterium]
MIETHDLRKKIEIYFIVGLVFVAVLYGAYRAYPLIMGPSIEIISPIDGDIVPSDTFKVIGSAKRAKVITLQGKPIMIDTDGGFIETVVSSPPYTTVIMTATDNYGKTITKVLRVTPE